MTPVTQRCSFSTATQTKDCLSIETPKCCIILSDQKMHFYFLDQERRIKIIINTVSAKTCPRLISGCPNKSKAELYRIQQQQQHKHGVMDAFHIQSYVVNKQILLL